MLQSRTASGRWKRARRPIKSIEVGGKPRVLGMGEHALDLSGGGAPNRQVRQVVTREERDLAGLDARTGAASRELADEEQFVDRIEVLRTIALAVVVYGGQLDCAGLESGFLEHLAHGALGRRLVHIGPAPRQRPG